MSQSQVEAILGRPSSMLEPPPPEHDQRPATWASRWQWGDTLSSAATSAVFIDQPPPARVGVVWFDAQGKVIEVRAPQAEPPPTADPWAAPPR
ncbi:MAG: outer membrane protein assembly factor BamE [Phycisphaerales bacterium]|nr:outer membrane protein assembly factor BamE [Phycisphaerales bacterium]